MFNVVLSEDKVNISGHTADEIRGMIQSELGGNFAVVIGQESTIDGDAMDSHFLGEVVEKAIFSVMCSL